ncbi:hypothetical protein DEO72_LG5g982 [Vigna unguiculata]|uniref:Uncharacterized protein n=1 Tax=Vigna unguiculata TaxID=3917 RepID=A0A4D6LWQ6_VIGUN|nr:hypothetical protein DEO72_LG5g982 [Vigna unguiculata]
MTIDDNHLAIKSTPSGDNDKVSGLLKLVHLAVRGFRYVIFAALVFSEALRAWQYVLPARRSRGGQRLVPREKCQAGLLQQIGVMLAMMCVIYKTSRLA